jgi:hypothetical protein
MTSHGTFVQILTIAVTAEANMGGGPVLDPDANAANGVLAPFFIG